MGVNAVQLEVLKAVPNHQVRGLGRIALPPPARVQQEPQFSRGIVDAAVVEPDYTEQFAAAFQLDSELRAGARGIARGSAPDPGFGQAFGEGVGKPDAPAG